METVKTTKIYKLILYPDSESGEKRTLFLEQREGRIFRAVHPENKVTLKLKPPYIAK